MPDYKSRFGYVPYDDIAANEQNILRDLCKKLETSFNAGSLGGFDQIAMPMNEYTGIAMSYQFQITKTPMDNQVGIETNLRSLEMIYYVMGKDIRIRCIERATNSQPGLTYPLPGWLEQWQRVIK